MDTEALIHDLFFNEQYNNLNSLLELVNTIYQSNLEPSAYVTSDFVDKQFLDEIKFLTLRGDVKLLFGKSLRDLKCVIRDSEDREHWALTQYKDQNRLRITSTSLPHALYQDQVYATVEAVVDIFKAHVGSLSNYFTELEKIDRFCSVVDPQKPSFKDDYRKIVLADRVWLHVEVTPEGGATNVHLIGHSDRHSADLQRGLTSWDHDRDILDNVMEIFDMSTFPQPARPSTLPAPLPLPPPAPLCGICLCAESARGAVPQPLCPRARCGAFFHRDCLYTWLVASAGGRAPPLGVVSGACPGCFEPISCAATDK